jgi:AbrB family looped-hinge helix DNA binding protein
MMVSIDRLGRIVVPKPLRDSLGLVAGTQMELVEEPDGFRLVVSAPHGVVDTKDGLPVIVSKRTITDDDIDSLIAEAHQ